MDEKNHTPLHSVFDISPEQYHAGLDKLWKAMPDYKGPQDSDVFTLAANRIADRDRLKDINAELLEACRFALAFSLDDNVRAHLRVVIAKAKKGANHAT